MENEVKNSTHPWPIVLVILAAVVLAWVMVLPPHASANHIKSPGTWTPPCGTPGGLACMLEEEKERPPPRSRTRSS